MSNPPVSSRNAHKGWLVLGWLAFWLGTVAYPCQAHPAPNGHVDQTVALEVGAGGHANPAAHPDSHPAHDDGTCHHLSAPVIGAPVIAAAVSGNPNVDSAAPVAAKLRQLATTVCTPGIHPASQPPPQTPLYLRTQRLLI